MSAPGPQARLRVALYAADGSIRGLLTGTLADVKANTPKGGSWRAVEATVRRVADVPRAAFMGAASDMA